jgi:cyanate lyase
MEYKGFILRGIIDKILIDHKAKTIRFIDLKTGQGPVDEFISSFIKWRYYLQSAIYTLAYSEVCKILGLKDYKFLPFQFLYIGRSERIPLLFTVSKLWHKASIYGFTTKAGYKYKGLNELLEEVRWHVDNKVFDVTKKVHESNGSVLLEDSFISLNK